MMRSLSAAVAGLNTQQTAMDVIGANISNINTVGYKGSRTSFQDVMSQTMQSATGSSGNRGGTNAVQIGMGVALAAVDTMTKAGSYQSTGRSTDLAIQKEGYFVVTDGKQQAYTRAGNFDFDAVGNFVIPGTGLFVRGWNAVNGVLDSSGQVSNIVVPAGISIPANPTTEMTFINNLSASSTPGTTAMTSKDVYDTLGKTYTLNNTFTNIGGNKWISSVAMSDSSPVTNGLTEITFDNKGGFSAVKQATVAAATTGLTVDAANLQLDNTTGSVHSAYYTVSDGAALHVLKATFTQMSDNKWTYAITDTSSKSTSALKTGEITYDGTSYADNNAANIEVITGKFITLEFDAAGKAPSGTSFNAATTPNAPPYTTAATVNPVTFTPTDAATVEVAMNYYDLTQYGTDTTVQASEQNGYAAGTLDSVSIDSNGKIIGTFTNGQTQDLAQIAMATFTNPGGLTRMGGSLFAESENSGFASIGTSGSGSRGEIQSGTLEMSNIDLADQFSKMIVAQRGFQSNSKIITVSDEMLEILANLKR